MSRQTSHFTRTAQQDMSLGLQPSNEALAAGTVDASSAARPAPREMEGTAALMARIMSKVRMRRYSRERCVACLCVGPCLAYSSGVSALLRFALYERTDFASRVHAYRIGTQGTYVETLHDTSKSARRNSTARKFPPNTQQLPVPETDSIAPAPARALTS